MRKVTNLTASPISITDLGITIPASSDYIIYQNEYPLWATSTNAQTQFDSGNIKFVDSGPNFLEQVIIEDNLIVDSIDVKHELTIPSNTQLLCGDTYTISGSVTVNGSLIVLS